MAWIKQAKGDFSLGVFLPIPKSGRNGSLDDKWTFSWCWKGFCAVQFSATSASLHIIFIWEFLIITLRQYRSKHCISCSKWRFLTIFLTFILMAPSHARMISKHPTRFFKVPRHVFDHLRPIKKISLKKKYLTQKMAKIRFSPLFTVRILEKSVFCANYPEFSRNIGSYYDLLLSGNQTSCVFPTLHRRVCRDKLSSALWTYKSFFSVQNRWK